MQKLKKLGLFCGLSLLLLAGCEKETKEDKGIGDTYVTTQDTGEEAKLPKEEEQVQKLDKASEGQQETAKAIEQQEEKTETVYEELAYTNPATDVLVFAADENGDSYALTADGVLTRYTVNGEVKNTYEGCIDFTAVCCEDGRLYAYDAVKCEIVMLDVTTGKKETVAEQLPAEEVLKMVKTEDALYLLLVPKNYQIYTGGDDYVGFGEMVYRVSLADGTKDVLLLDGVLALYEAENGELYYYAYQEKTYVLGKYDVETGKGIVCYDMLEQFGVKYLSAFAYEQDLFVYAELETPSIHVLSLKENEEVKKTENILLLSGNDMDCIKGNVLYFGYPVEEKSNCLQSFFLDGLLQ